MKELQILMSPQPDTAPVKEPETAPAEPGTSPSPGKDDDPWKVPAPDVEPTPKA
jgi:hypothetical protein